MSFLDFILQSKCRTDSLQAGISKRIGTKRISRFISMKGAKAAISMEAALVMPVFLFFVINLMSVITILSSYSRIQAAVQEIGMKLAGYAYVKETTTGHLSTESLPDGLDTVLEGLASPFLVKGMVEKQLGEEKKLEYSKSEILQDHEDIVDVIVHYPVSPMFRMAGFGSFRLINRCRVKGFNGYRIDGRHEGAGEEEIVYITATGNVYHRDRSCTYLRLSIKTVFSSAIETARNENGGKYYPCEKCGKNEHSGFYYITGQGDRYHTTVNCTGLKRTVIEIFLSHVGDRTPCTRCGG